MNNYVEKVKTNGIVKIDNWLNDIDQKKIAKIIQTLKPQKNDPDSTFVTNLKLLIKKIFKFKLNNVFTSIYYFNLSKKLNLKEIAEEILEAKVKLTRIDHYWSPKSEKPVIQWHIDNAYSGRENIKNFVKPDQNAIKFFFYLSDVSSDNGCLSYIPKSHKIAYALKEGIYNGNIEYQTYWTLSDFRKIILIKENYNYIKKTVDENLITEFLNTSKLILNGELDAKLFDHEVRKGGALIFDEAGAHRGSRTMLHDRMVLRFFYKKK